MIYNIVHTFVLQINNATNAEQSLKLFRETAYTSMAVPTIKLKCIVAYLPSIIAVRDQAPYKLLREIVITKIMFKMRSYEDLAL